MWSILNKQTSIIESAQEYDQWLELVRGLAEGRISQSISVDGDLSLSHLRIRQIPQMTVYGNLDLRQCQRLSGIGDPLTVHGDLFIGGGYAHHPQYQQRLLKEKHIPSFLSQLSHDGYAPLRSLPNTLTVTGDLLLRCCDLIEELPPNLKIGGSLFIGRCNHLQHIPESIQLNHGLYISGCRRLKRLPENLIIKRLALIGSRIDALPNRLTVTQGIHLENCPQLVTLSGLNDLDTESLDYFAIKKCPVRELPDNISVTDRIILSDLIQSEIESNLTAKSIFIDNCKKLKHISGALNAANTISLRNNRNLQSFSASPRAISILDVENCEALPGIPENLLFDAGYQTVLTIKNCKQIGELPKHVIFNGYLEIFGSNLKDIPQKMAGCQLMWHNHWVNSDLMFHPERLTPDRILSETNAEVRRLMLEKVGIDNVLSKAEAVEIHQDVDAGGKRYLIRLTIKVRGRDYDIMFLRCCCPSSGREYLLSVPDNLDTCHEAAAWIAGFDNPSEYQPIQET